MALTEPLRYYDIILPLPVSINAAHQVGAGFFNKKTRKWERVKGRSDEYKNWIEYASIDWRQQYPRSVKDIFSGRIRLDLIFVWSTGQRGHASSDLDNRIKVLQDFLQFKFFQNDNQIDEIHAFRRIGGEKSHVKVRISEIADRRFIDSFV